MDREWIALTNDQSTICAGLSALGTQGCSGLKGFLAFTDADAVTRPQPSGTRATRCPPTHASERKKKMHHACNAERQSTVAYRRPAAPDPPPPVNSFCYFGQAADTSTRQGTKGPPWT